MTATSNCLVILILLGWLCTAISAGASDTEEHPAVAGNDPGIYDIAIVGARVIDPETKVDAVTNIGIRVGLIKAITPDSLRATIVIDGRGRCYHQVLLISTAIHPPNWGSI